MLHPKILCVLLLAIIFIINILSAQFHSFYSRVSSYTYNQNLQSIRNIPEPESILQQRLQDYGRILPSDATIREKLAFHFPYNNTENFPKNIWQSWKVNSSDPNFPTNFQNFQKSWKTFNLNYNHQILDDKFAFEFIEKNFQNKSLNVLIDVYKKLPIVILKADFLRYLIGFVSGGVYTDIDTTALKSIDDWASTKLENNIGLAIGIEADPDRKDWHDWYARRIQFCQWTFHSKPGHPLLREIIARIVDITLSGKYPKNKHGEYDVMNWTGPGIWSDTIFDYLNNYDVIHPNALSNSNPNSDLNLNDKRVINDEIKQVSEEEGKINFKTFTGLEKPKVIGDVMILPITSFSPGVGHMGSKSIDDEMAYVKHFFKGSWKNNN